MFLFKELQFQSVAEFIDMGGYGFFVWCSYGVFALVFLGLLVAPIIRRNQLLTLLNRQNRRKKIFAEEKVNEAST